MPDPTKRKRFGEQKILDYYDVLLREQDVSLLEGPYWLNDQVVAFWFEFLQREGLQQTAVGGTAPPLTHGTSPPVGRHPAAVGAAGAGCTSSQQLCLPLEDALLLPPSTSFLLMFSSPDVAAEVLAPLKLQLKGLVVFAVNDNTEVDVAAGGSHWSLLVYHRTSNTLRHYDSSPASCSGADAAGSAARRSSHAARRLAAAVGPALVSGGAAARSGSSSSSSAPAAPLPRLVEVSAMPRQGNGYDCGVYVLAVARAVCEWWGAQGGAWGLGALEAQRAVSQEAEWEARERELARWLTPSYVKGLRTEVLELIRAKAAAAAAAVKTGKHGLAS